MLSREFSFPTSFPNTWTYLHYYLFDWNYLALF